MEKFPHPPFPAKNPGNARHHHRIAALPDHGENSYQGFRRLKDKRAIITGGDSASAGPWRSPMRARDGRSHQLSQRT